MNSEKVISNIKKAIKEHLDNNYAYDMLVDFELDVIDWNSLFEYIDKLQQENKRLKIQVSAREEVANKYKKVIDEVRKFIEDWLFDAGGNGASMTYEDINELLQILDKGESNE